MAGFGFDPQAAAFAQQNYLSGNADLAKLDKSHNLARQAVINRLASHGILNSGHLGYGEGEADQQYGNQVYDNRTALLNLLRGFQSQVLTGKQKNQQLLSDAKFAAEQRAVDKRNSDVLAWAAAHGVTTS